MITTQIVKDVLIVVLGGLYIGWTLGKLPDKWIYAIVAAAIILGIIVFK